MIQDFLPEIFRIHEQIAAFDSPLIRSSVALNGMECGKGGLLHSAAVLYNKVYRKFFSVYSMYCS